MFIYNVTVKINRNVESEWLDWMQNSHIPAILRTRQFTGSKISRLLKQPEGDDPTYIIQYDCETIENYHHYLDHFADALRDEYDRRYKNKYVAFRTVMEVIE